MRKRGFTLAELLIVLGIAGVVAAVILPAINGLMPDKTKINYLKVYDELGNNIKSMVADTSLFPILLKEGSTDIDVSRYPLVNNSQPLKAPFKDDTKYSGDKKLCNLLAHTFGADSCNTTSYPDKSSFTTSNGMEWWISQTKREIDTVSNKIAYQTDIYVDVDSSKKSPNCMYGEDGCKQPDRFKFLLAADGRLVPADPVGVHYINTRKNLLKKKFEAEGEVLASLEDVDFNNGHSNNIDNPVTDNNKPIDNDVDDNVTEPPKDNEPPAADDEEQEDIDPCNAKFVNPKLGTLTVVCLYKNVLHGQTSYFPEFTALYKDGLGKITSLHNALIRDDIHTGSRSYDIQVGLDYFYVCIVPRYRAMLKNESLRPQCYVNDKYKNRTQDFRTMLSTSPSMFDDWRKYVYINIENSDITFFNALPTQSGGFYLMTVYPRDKYYSNDAWAKNGWILNFSKDLLPQDIDKYDIDDYQFVTVGLLYNGNISPRYDKKNIYIVVEPNTKLTIEDVAAWVLYRNIKSLGRYCRTKSIRRR